MRSTSALPRIDPRLSRAACLPLLAAVLLGGGSPAETEERPASPAEEASEPAPAGEATEAPAEAGPQSARQPNPLDALQAHYERVQNLRARFEQRSLVASLGREEVSSGALLVERPGRMRWEYEAPSSHVLTIQGDTVRMYLPAEKQLQVAALDPASFSPTALSFLLGEGDLRSDFTHEAIPAPGRPELGLRLFPKGDASFEQLEIWLDPASLQLRESVLVDLFGNRTSVRFSDMVENRGLPADAFELDVPTDTETIDLR